MPGRELLLLFYLTGLRVALFPKLELSDALLLLGVGAGSALK